MTRNRAILAAVAAALAVTLLIGWPGGGDLPRSVRTDRDVPAAEPASPAKRAIEPRAITRTSEMPRGEAVPRADLLDDPNRVPGPDLEIRGLVYRSGRPVAGALVRLCRGYPADREPEPSPEPFVETRSLDDGSFVARAARRSSLVIEVRHEGSAIRRLFVVMPLVGDPDPVRIELARGHDLAVKVIEPGGAPVADAVVRVWCAGGAPFPVAVRWYATEFAATQGTAPRAQIEAKTDADGSALFRGVEAGVVRIETGGVSEHVVVPTGVEVVFVRESPGTVAGTLRREDGSPVAHAGIEIETAGFRERLGTAGARTDGEGQFRVEGVPPGWIVGGRVDRARRVDGPPLLLRPGAAAEWHAVIRPSRTVRGRTVAADGRPLPTVRVALGNDDGGDSAWSDEEGWFELRVPEPGEYGLVAKAFGLRASAAVVVPCPPIEVVLEPCARVVGRIVGLRDPSDRRTEVVLESGNVKRRTLADASGRFAFEHLPPLQDARVTPGDPGRFDVPADAVVELEIDLQTEHWGSFVGEVRDHEGRPVVGAVVTPDEWGFLDMRLTQPSFSSAAVTDDDGCYELVLSPRKAPHMIRVLASHPGLATEKSKVVPWPQRGESSRLDFNLWPAAPLHGRVIDADGRPVRHALVEAVQTESTHTASDGTFRFTRLAPRRYWIHVFAEDFPSRSVEAETGAAEVVIALAGSGRIAGIVVPTGDRSAEHCLVIATSGSGEYEALTSASGRFCLADLPPGAYDVRLNDGAPVRNVPTGTDDLVLRERP